MAKSPLLSKTLWFNGLALVLAVSGAFGYIEFIPDRAYSRIRGSDYHRHQRRATPDDKPAHEVESGQVDV